jgi:hypothetical protein
MVPPSQPVWKLEPQLPSGKSAHVRGVQGPVPQLNALQAWSGRHCPQLSKPPSSLQMLVGLPHVALACSHDHVHQVHVPASQPSKRFGQLHWTEWPQESTVAHEFCGQLVGTQPPSGPDSGASIPPSVANSPPSYPRMDAHAPVTPVIAMRTSEGTSLLGRAWCAIQLSEWSSIRGLPSRAGATVRDLRTLACEGSSRAPDPQGARSAHRTLAVDLPTVATQRGPFADDRRASANPAPNVLGRPSLVGTRAFDICAQRKLLWPPLPLVSA